MKLPKGWKIKAIGEISDVAGGIQKGPHREASANPVRYLTVAHVQRNRLLLDDPRYFEVTGTELERWRLLKGDVLIIEGNGSSDQIGRTALFRGEIAECVHQNHVIRVRPNPDAVSGEYLNTLMNSSVGQAVVQLQSSTSSGLRTLSVGKIREMHFPFPPLPEQRKIADILTTWDEALDRLDALIEAQERRKKALMQQLLTGKTRVKGAKGKWKKMRFGEWLTESRIPGTDGSSARKLTVKLYGRGVLSKQDRLVGSENTKYYVRKSGQFIYSKLDFLNGAFGIVPETLDGYQSTLDLPAFDVSPTADAKWLLYFVSRPEFYTQQLGAAAGGRKARRVNPSEFLAMKILAPDLVEQRQISAILDTADQQITLLRAQRTALDQQKRGLMQRLLTGRIRVRTN